MTLDQWAAVGELAGGIATIGTLVYLAVQLRQNTRALRAGSAWESETLWAHLNFANARDPAFSVLLARLFDPEADPASFSEEEAAQLQWMIRGILQVQQSHYLLWRDGSLPTDYYETRRDWTRWFVRLPLVTPVLLQERANGILHGDFDREILESWSG